MNGNKSLLFPNLGTHALELIGIGRVYETEGQERRNGAEAQDQAE